MLNLMVRLDCSRCKRKVPVSFRDRSEEPLTQYAHLTQKLYVWKCDGDDLNAMYLCGECQDELKGWMIGRTASIIFDTEFETEATEQSYPHVNRAELKKLEASNPPAKVEEVTEEKEEKEEKGKSR
jgi:hypothetical protein